MILSLLLALPISQRIEPQVPDYVDAFIRSDSYVINGIETQSARPVVDAYREVDETLSERVPVVLGIEQGTGYVGLGAAWGSPESFSVRDKDEEGINVIFVGLQNSSEVGPIFLGEQFDRVERVEFHNIGIRGPQDSFAVRQFGLVHNLVFNNFWVIAPPTKFESLFHLGEGWDTLTIKGYQARGVEVQHHCFYLKGGGRTQILDNELWGGNRTGVQIRPHQAPWVSPAPTGNILIDGNYASNFGWNHENPDGGGWISVWSSLNHRVIITNNTCVQARYSCLVLAQPPEAQEPYLTADGYAHGFVGVMNNTFDNTGSQRACVSFAATRVLVLGPNNNCTSNQHVMELNTWWNATYTNALPVRTWWLLGNQSLPSFPIHTWDYDMQAYRQLSSDELVSHIR